MTTTLSSFSQYSNCDLTDDYNNAALWTQLGVDVSISGGKVIFNNASDDAERRVYRNIPPLSNTWYINFKFLGSYASSAGPGHTLLAATAGTLDATNFPASPPYGISNQNCIMIDYMAVPIGGPPSQWFLMVKSKVGAVFTGYTPGIILNIGTTYYVTLERLDYLNGKISVFLNSGRTVHAAGSPLCFTIPPGVDNLTVLQHGAIPHGSVARVLSGEIDSLCVYNFTLPSMSPIVGTNTLCTGVASNYSVTPVTNATGYTWTSTPTATITGQGTSNISFQASTPGVYTLIVQADMPDCYPLYSDTMQITVGNGIPNLLLTTNSHVCVGDSIHLDIGNGSGFTYQWTGPGSFSSTVQNSDIANASSSSQGWYYVTASSVNCGSVTDSVYVIVNPSPAPLTFSNIINSTCNNTNGSATVNTATGSSPCTYIWNTSPVQNSQTAVNLSGGNYSVTVTDANGCSATNSVSITTSAGISLGITTLDANCNQGGAATAVVSGNPLEYTYIWSNGETTQTISNLAPGSYSVTVSLLSCSNTATAQISASSGPQAAVSWTPSYITVDNPDVSFHDQSSGSPVSWQWTWDNGSSSSLQNPVNSFNTPGTYAGMLIITDINGCSDTAYFTIFINDASTFYIPNTFTPDADGINDYFGPSGIGMDPDNFEFYIYNRWGEELFHSTSINYRWDGTYKGEIVPQGIYVWLVIYKQLGFDKKLKEAGHVNVIK